jgi:uncharacterized membrane protein
MEKNRVEPYSDCVFSIVATLLVIELKLPDTGSVFHSLGVIAPKLLTFVVSFIIISMYWVAHHTVFNFINKVNRNLLWLNNLHLLAVIFLPFPAAVLGSHPFDPHAIILYGGALILANVTLTFLWLYATTHPDLAKENLTPFIAHRMRWLHLAPTLLYAAAMAISYVNVWISLAIFVLTPAFYIVPNPWFKRVIRASDAAEQPLHKSRNK